MLEKVPGMIGLLMQNKLSVVFDQYGKPEKNSHLIVAIFTLRLFEQISYAVTFFK